MICHSLLGNRATRIPSTIEESLKMRQINSCINHFEIKLNLTLTSTEVVN